MGMMIPAAIFGVDEFVYLVELALEEVSVSGPIESCCGVTWFELLMTSAKVPICR